MRDFVELDLLKASEAERAVAALKYREHHEQERAAFRQITGTVNRHQRRAAAARARRA